MPRVAELVDIGKLRPYPRNPRKHDEIQVGRLAESIEQFGFNQPILADENFEILAGHGRLLAAKKLGLKTIPVIQIHHLNAFQKDAFRLLDNKIALDSDWDTESMDEFIESLTKDDFDFGFWGCEKLKKPGKEKNPKEDDAEEKEGPATRELITCPNCMHEFEQ